MRDERSVPSFARLAEDFEAYGSLDGDNRPLGLPNDDSYLTNIDLPIPYTITESGRKYLRNHRLDNLQDPCEHSFVADRGFIVCAECGDTVDESRLNSNFHSSSFKDFR
jgi:hypothetical protein